MEGIGRAWEELGFSWERESSGKDAPGHSSCDWGVIIVSQENRDL